MQRKDSLYLFILAAIALVGVVLLAVLGRKVEPELWTTAGLVIGGVVGIARQDAGEPAQGVTIPGSVAPHINVNAGPAVEPSSSPAVTLTAPASPAAPAAPAQSSSLWAGSKAAQ